MKDKRILFFFAPALLFIGALLSLLVTNLGSEENPSEDIVHSDYAKGYIQGCAELLVSTMTAVPKDDKDMKTAANTILFYCSKQYDKSSQSSLKDKGGVL